MEFKIISGASDESEVHTFPSGKPNEIVLPTQNHRTNSLDARELRKVCESQKIYPVQCNFF